MPLYLRHGPPGTGKTSTLCDKVAEAITYWGSHRIMVCSLTRTAAAAIHAKNVPIDPKQIGTLHSHCYRMIGGPKIANTKIHQFNEETNEQYRLSARHIAAKFSEENDNQEILVDQHAESLFSRYGYLRAAAIPRDQWSPSILDFAECWENWKERHEYLDFQDLIDVVHRDFDGPPKQIMYVAADEAQDHSVSELKLLEKWAQTTNVALFSDEDQCIFDFRGADAAHLHQMPFDSIKELNHSYRLPKTVRDYALRWIEQLTDRRKIIYNPRDALGSVRRITASFSDPEALWQDYEQNFRDQDVMFIASCGYMLQPMITFLKEHGIPFHNPYRHTDSTWNPLARRSGVTSTVDRVRDFLSVGTTGQNRWTLRQFQRWSEMITANGLLVHGAKEKLKHQVEDWPKHIEMPTMGDDEFSEYFVSPEAAYDVYQHAWGGDAGWLLQRCLGRFEKPLEYSARIVGRSGVRALYGTPRVVVGTIHSVKGGEASCVFLSPDVSPEAYRTAWSTKDTGSLIRTAYVGMTRAKENLVLCGSSRHQCLKWLNQEETT